MKAGIIIVVELTAAKIVTPLEMSALPDFMTHMSSTAFAHAQLRLNPPLAQVCWASTRPYYAAWPSYE
jgi:hypothetical protein